MVVAKRVQPVTNLREFFRDALHGALEKQQLAVEDQTEHYVVNLLTLFARSEALYEQTADGVRLKPLVVMLSEALEASGHAERNRSLQRLGDVSLFVAGFFAHGFAAQADRHRLSHRHGRARLRRAGRHPARGAAACWPACSPSCRRNSSPWSMPSTRSARAPTALATRTSCACTRSG